MKRLALTFSLVAIISTQTWAQEPAVFESTKVDPPSPAAKAQDRQLTPEMYRYLSDLQRYGGPTDLTRQRAQLKAQQRQERMAAMKWYGMSNSRPIASPTPFMGTYSPGWSSNTANPFQWRDLRHFQQVHIEETASQPSDNVRR